MTPNRQYTSTRKGTTHKDNQSTEGTSVDFSVDGGGGDKQLSTDHNQELIVNNSGMKRAPRFTKKANFVNLKIGADQLDRKLDLVSFNPVGWESDNARKIHTALLFAKVIFDPVDTNKVRLLMSFYWLFSGMT